MKEFSEEMRYDYQLPPGSLVLDFGGYEGEFAIKTAQRNLCRVWCFEPVRKFFTGITNRIGHYPSIIPINAGVAACAGWRDVSLSNNSSGVFGESGDFEPCYFMAVEDIFDMILPGRVALMKMNIEGLEFETLERMFECGLERFVDNAQIQFHDCAPDARNRYAKIREKLLETHELTFDNAFVWENYRLRANA